MHRKYDWECTLVTIQKNESYNLLDKCDVTFRIRIFLISSQCYSQQIMMILLTKLVIFLHGS